MQKIYYSKNLSFDITDAEFLDAMKAFSSAPSAFYANQRLPAVFFQHQIAFMGLENIYSGLVAYIGLMDDPPAMQSVNQGTIKVPLLKRIYWASPVDNSFYEEEENDKGVKGLKRVWLKFDCLKPLEKWILVKYDVWLEKKLYLFSDRTVWQEAKKYNELKPNFYSNISENKNEGEKTTEKEAIKTS